MPQITARMKKLHPRNIHNQEYDFYQLIKASPNLANYITRTPSSQQTIDFANPSAVKALNAALLKHHYRVTDWNIPDGALCPPVPGRVDYIHYIADLLDSVEPDKSVRMLDIGTGTNGIYPLLASSVYDWECVATDISKASLDNVAKVLKSNAALKSRISLRLQHDKHKMFEGVVLPQEQFDISVCNPPFHASAEDALRGSQRKVANLNKGKAEPKSEPLLNFGGMENELWCNGGEALFLKKMIKESKQFASQIHWFTSLVSKAENLKPLSKLANKAGATDVKIIEMTQGKKQTRILAWTFQAIG
ncbi:23S rRNA (adenine(1618)-N(6))-methyltransferase RlmF [Thalassolituus sp. UBA2590]|uniref:23S rRNA (adenine(1618)-N(6))-methyltransferase RlmF n=1 Tax=Thalassolituus sp. UBA2590 TaxID=1947663 RepID=UPI00264876AC|nr:23S rRNA (adenine(1618)-N(6))-methyltransferase RlmF [Thalassolituus sp. UBA2590]